MKIKFKNLLIWQKTMDFGEDIRQIRKYYWTQIVMIIMIFHTILPKENTV